MKKTLFHQYFLESLLALIVFAQANLFAQPVIQWDKTIGGTNTDALSQVLQTADGGYLLGGTSFSNASGDKTENNNGAEETSDYWVVKLSAKGIKEWDKTFGTVHNDQLTSMQQTADGGYILGGSSNGDYWIIKLNANGTKQWDKTYGRGTSDYLSVVRQTPDGGYILGGSSLIPRQPTDYPLAPDRYEFYVVKISAAGTVQWEKAIGQNIRLTCLDLTDDGGYILGGYYGVQQDSKGGYNLFKLAANGTEQWTKIIAGTYSAYIQDIQQTQDKGYILGGWSAQSAGGDQKEDSLDDYWIVKLNANREIEWENVIGVPLDEEGSKSGIVEFKKLAKSPDGGYLLLGNTRESARGDKTENSINGSVDFWVVKINASGNVLWDKTIGGSEGEVAASVSATSDGGYILGGTSASNAGYNKSENSKGSSDFWIVKLAPENPPLAETPIRINAGGPAFTTATQKLFIADQYYAGIDRTSSIASGDILNTTNDVLYRSGRCSPSFSYNIPVPNGEVNVYLHFAETYYGAPGKKGGAGSRQFHVNMEGIRKLTNYDIFTAAGGAMRATAETFTVNVTDGMLNIDFLSGAADMPRVSAIEVIRTISTLKPVADAYVRDGSYKVVNYGSAASLDIKNNASDLSARRSSYLRFQLPTMTAVTSARLRIYGHNHENTKSVSVHAYSVNNDSWTENEIVKSNAPAASTASLGYASVNNAYKYYEIDVTSFVKSQQQSGESLVSFMLADPNNRNIRVIFNSKESSVNPPELVVQTSPVVKTNTRLSQEVISSNQEAEPEPSSVYPNPVRKQFTVKISDKHSENISLDLLNSAGQSYQVTTAEKVTAGQKAEVDIANLALSSGIYLLKIQSEAATEVIKLLVTE